MFPDFFSGYRKRKVACNGLMKNRKWFKFFTKLRIYHFALTSKENPQPKNSPMFLIYLAKHLFNHVKQLTTYILRQ